MVCQGCRYYRPLTPAAGECRRSPPLLVLGEAAWLTIPADSPGCGEFVGTGQQRPGGEPDAPP